MSKIKNAGQLAISTPNTIIWGNSLLLQPSQEIKLDFGFSIGGTIEYPFLFIPKVHMRCLICKLRFSILDVTMPGVNSNRIESARAPGQWECPHCDSTIAKSMGDRISQFLGEDV